MSGRALLLMAVAASLAACTSPESTRTRGSGPGAAKGNRGEFVMIHEGSKPYAGTPVTISADPPPLETANHAHMLSTEG